MTMKSHYREKPRIQILLGDRIRQLRKTKGWSQEKLAGEATSIEPTSTVLNVANVTSSLPNIKKIADTLDVSIGKLFEEV